MYKLSKFRCQFDCCVCTCCTSGLLLSQNKYRGIPGIAVFLHGRNFEYRQSLVESTCNCGRNTMWDCNFRHYWYIHSHPEGKVRIHSFTHWTLHILAQLLRLYFRSLCRRNFHIAYKGKHYYYIAVWSFPLASHIEVYTASRGFLATARLLFLTARKLAPC